MPRIISGCAASYGYYCLGLGQDGSWISVILRNLTMIGGVESYGT